MIELHMPPLPYYLGSGLTEYKNGDQHPHRSNIGAYDLLILVRGEMYIGENGSQWTLTEGDMLLLLPDGEHYPIRPCDQDTVFYWVHFEHAPRRDASVAEEVENNTSPYTTRPFINPYTLRLPKFMHLTDSRTVFGMVEQLLTQPSTLSFWQEQQLLGELLSLLEEECFGRTDSVASRLAERTVAYLQANYREKVTNEAIASALHFHPNYIVRCMKSRYGCTPSDYLQQFRLERAKRLLVTTDWSIDRVAEEVGFRYSPYFSSCFKQEFGSSPLQFRKQYLK
ncbi:AraC family transcriptional regulator [Paenibacillus illinoisensis]|uniref:AraC family transcriptional regulator n=1 Tax=Paenibacillus illinoisensis TaxID=59845 RepID=UPI001C8DB770|nr:AraC family transcriptional regulator [Paenibacillus illinoisensis]MBY0218062.1 helix-turn-helix transcriptional regulator [Paenibacillus illinoisensis]